MKKYFFKSTGGEIQFGDRIQLDFTKELSNGRFKHHSMDCTFIPELVDLLLEQDVIEVQEEEMPRSVISFADSVEEDLIENIIKANEDLEKKVEVLVGKVNTLEVKVDLLLKSKKTAKQSVGK